ncbi:MAG TPA: thioredoxin family protein [Candidatus Bipolaricaulota bacterium]
MKIEILGMGCPKCQKTEQLVKKALEELNLQAEVVKVTDPNEIAKRGVFFTPGVVVDGQVKSSGKVPSIGDLKKMLFQ